MHRTDILDHAYELFGVRSNVVNDFKLCSNFDMHLQ